MGQAALSSARRAKAVYTAGQHSPGTAVKVVCCNTSAATLGGRPELELPSGLPGSAPHSPCPPAALLLPLLRLQHQGDVFKVLIDFQGHSAAPGAVRQRGSRHRAAGSGGGSGSGQAAAGVLWGYRLQCTLGKLVRDMWVVSSRAEACRGPERRQCPAGDLWRSSHALRG